MPKLTLDFEEDYDFDLIGICSHIKDYRMVWELNQSLNFDFIRKENYDLSIRGEFQSHSFFEFLDEDNAIQYSIINNKCESGYLIPEEKNCDYLLVIKGGQLIDERKQELVKRISQLNHVLTTYLVEVDNLKSKENLLF